LRGPTSKGRGEKGRGKEGKGRVRGEEERKMREEGWEEGEGRVQPPK